MVWWTVTNRPSDEESPLKYLVVALTIAVMLLPGCHRIMRKLGLSHKATPAPAASVSPATNP